MKKERLDPLDYIPIDTSAEAFRRARKLAFDGWFDTDVKPDVMEAIRHLSMWPPDDWPRPDPGPKQAVAIVGKAYERYIAPWGKPGWELWGLNQADARPPVEAYDRWFQLHPPRYLGRHSKDSLEDLQIEWTRDRGVRLYMERHYKKYPNSEPYPKEEVEALVPHGRYHTSSFDWMLALAILEGFEHIGIYGCQFFSPPPYNGEPMSARPCLEYWAGVAEGRGSEVQVISFMGDVFRTVHFAKKVSNIQYGFGEEPGLELGDGWRDVR